MMLKKLAPEEHWKTRTLWETIFTEDTKEFLDYYYSVKTKENEIYVIEKDSKIVSMIHLNPYLMRIGEQVYQTHYIVAVATDATYRKQGLMRMLLEYVMQVMKERGEPFTFLMPASEAIYKPFGFRFIYTQHRGYFTGRNHNLDGVDFVLAEEKDCDAMACFANEILQKYDVVTVRTASYYQTLLKEQQSEKGGVLLAKKSENIVGLFCYANGKEWEIREPLYRDITMLERAIYEVTKDEMTKVFCTGIGTEEKPMIMAKILNKGMIQDFLNLKVFLNEVV